MLLVSEILHRALPRCMLGISMATISEDNKESSAPNLLWKVPKAQVSQGQLHRDPSFRMTLVLIPIISQLRGRLPRLCSVAMMADTVNSPLQASKDVPPLGARRCPSGIRPLKDSNALLPMRKCKPSSPPSTIRQSLLTQWSSCLTSRYHFLTAYRKVYQTAKYHGRRLQSGSRLIANGT